MVKPTDQVFPTEAHVAMDHGIELRTWIATQAMCAFITHLSQRHSFEEEAHLGVTAADALIKELNK